ncbi:helix-turn-helix domain-containing protein [Enhydrobacter sp.]|jgi:DNA-binding HxlR family transcriptional regulator|uniref:winged helix-turn-helix transcriptional regulator n=1 Tax=Enhydrobacter sp. TaxID=1894999 RepID=UPI0026275648|nr:helix-turn-helix domain-containing protein [Enhydrobacter sp.]WIM11111.1 MAG: Transcriptional regulator, HxlR family [Enhydrobacter sp.]
MRRKSLSGAACPIARTLDVIGDWWSLLIVRDALRGMRRFGEFEKSLGVSKNILTQRLRALVSQGILERAAAADGGAYREYHLTAKGRGLFQVLVALGQWGQENVSGPAGRRMILVDRKHRQPVRKLEVRAGDGRLLAPGETMMARLD